MMWWLGDWVKASPKKILLFEPIRTLMVSIKRSSSCSCLSMGALDASQLKALKVQGLDVAKGWS